TCTGWYLPMGRRSFAWIRFWPSRKNTQPGNCGLLQLPDTKKGEEMKFTSLSAPVGLLAVLAMPVGQLLQAQAPKPARYTVADIGTLGGANSFSYSMTDSGTVVGGANISGQNDFVAQTGFVWYGGQPISLGTLGGSACPDCSSEGAAAMANGAVVLLSETA